ncbi:rod shape-determining protein MreC [Lampropedia puyangensis]|uniref:Cell shape-determining protein MreC n=1 Tax=Lampropedia puyangensis TaxID=1330072 RepID=A0A4S8F060_9BURK|nr:rod shape-determining protein MreC [Lampropedia puyangensis]THT99363.1 rod shape-determining protein MreC [Lampropedia puyangensis]
MFERRTPHIFAQGPSPVAKLLVFGALALLLMVVDARFQVTGPVRQTLASAIYPLQWLMWQPVRGWHIAQTYTRDVQDAQSAAQEAQRQVVTMAERINHMEALERENDSLRAMLGLRERVSTNALSAEIAYEAPDPFTNRLVIDKGMAAGVREGAPVLDSFGVLGQVTQVYPLSSEVRIVTDRDQSVPVMNLRTGLRMVAFGEASNRTGNGLELRFVPAGSDVQEGDMLITSGIDGYYPQGIPVAEISFVEAHNDAPFIRILARPVAQVHSARYVMVLDPVGLRGENGPELPQETPSSTNRFVPPSSTPATEAALSRGR